MNTVPARDIWHVGIDEVGRGALAGPATIGLVAARASARAALQKALPNVTDSKKLSPKKRAVIADNFKAFQNNNHDQVIAMLVHATPKEIDGKGIQVCLKGCIVNGLQTLCQSYDILPRQLDIALDGMLYAPTLYPNQTTITKGDESNFFIGLASILAKEGRDAMMRALHPKHPEYAWENNMGYGTKAHREAIQHVGTTKYHRVSFLQNLV